MNSQGDYKPETQLPSTSCPQLTVDEITNTENTTTDDSNTVSRTQTADMTHGSQSSLKCRLSGFSSNQNTSICEDKIRNEPGWMPISSKSLLTKTYSFKRIISFRSDNFRRGNHGSIAGGRRSPNNLGRSPPSPYYSKDHHRSGCYNPSNVHPHKPLTFSFLGQIYAKTSIKGERSMPR